MSITFEPTNNRWIGVCDIEDRVEYSVPDPSVPQVNVSQSHAVLVLNALGYQAEGEDNLSVEGDLDGAEAPESFLGRVELALALAPADEGIPERELLPSEKHPVYGNATVIDLGREPGYLQARLHGLREVALYALQHGQAVVWA